LEGYSFTIKLHPRGNETRATVLRCQALFVYSPKNWRALATRKRSSLLFDDTELATWHMRLIGFSLLFSALILSAHADLTIVQKIEGEGPISEMTLKIKGDKVRAEVNPQVTMLIDGKTGETITLMNDQKTAMRISADKMKAAQEMTRQFNAKNEDKAIGEKSKLSPTGKREIINGYQAEQYSHETPKFKAIYWIATNYPDGGAILKQLQSAEVWKTSNTYMPDYRDFPGLPIKTILSVGGKEITATLIAVKQDPLSDTDFMIPKDYQEMKLPDMSGLLQQKSTPATSPKP
jgi:Domain of unknown function (DUF4412)